MNPTAPLLQFYGCLICPYVQRARTALIELDIPYSYEQVDLLRNEQFSSWYQEINSLSKVPALILPDQRVICQSLVIVEYLDDVYGKPGSKSIFPEDPVEKAKIKQWVSYLDSSVLSKSFPIYGAIMEKSKEQVVAAVQQVQEGLKFLVLNSGYLNRQDDAKAKGGDDNIYFWGPQFTFFDVACLPFFQNLELLVQAYYPDVDIFQSVSEEKKELMTAFENYYRFASQRNSFQMSNNKVSSLPTPQRSRTLEDLQIDSLEKWSYEAYYKSFMEVRLRPVVATEQN